MRKEYDFSKAKRNPYAKRLKQSVTMRLDTATVEYFKGLAGELDVPYQTLINLYLRDCAITGRRPAMHWRPSRSGAAQSPKMAAPFSKPGTAISTAKSAVADLKRSVRG